MELTQRIRKFADDHSDGIEDADKIEKMLNGLLEWITSHCCNARRVEGLSIKACDVEVYAVPTIDEKLCVTIKTVGMDLRGEFDYGIPIDQIKDIFLGMLDKGEEKSK